MGEILTDMQKHRRKFERKINTVDNYKQHLLESPEMISLRMIEKTINSQEFESTQNLIKIKKEHEIISNEINKNTEIYNLEMIKKISNKYNLGFFKIKRYEGYRPSFLPKNIESWFKSNDKPINEYDLENKLYIMSPLENFNVRSYFGVKLRFKKTETFLFYKENNETFLLISSWGKKNHLRDLISFTYNNDLSHLLFWSLMKMPIYTFLYSLIFTSESSFNVEGILCLSFFSSWIPSLISYSTESDLKIREEPRMNISYMWSKFNQ